MEASSSTLSSGPERSEVEGPAVLSTSNRTHMEAPPFPLSSRAQPRDLQFCRLVLEMFFEEAVWVLRPVRADGQTSAQPGRAGTSIPNIVRAPQARHTFTSTCIGTLSKNISRTSLQNCRSLGCARDDKGEGGAFIERPLADGEKPQVPPRRFAPVGKRTFPGNVFRQRVVQRSLRVPSRRETTFLLLLAR